MAEPFDEPPHDLVLTAANAMRDAGLHPCAVKHVSWRLMGGRPCHCDYEDKQCSVLVYSCDFCGDSDYGDNAEADEMRKNCERLYAPDPTTGGDA